MTEQEPNLQEFVNAVIEDFDNTVNAILSDKPFELSGETVETMRKLCIDITVTAKLQYVKLSLLQTMLTDELAGQADEAGDIFIGTNSFKPNGGS